MAVQRKLLCIPFITHEYHDSARDETDIIYFACTLSDEFLRVSIFGRPRMRTANYQNVKMKFKLLLSDGGFWKITGLELNIIHC